MADASHAAVIKALRSIKSYNGNGLLPESINYTDNFGRTCEVVRLVLKRATSFVRCRASPGAAPICRVPPRPELGVADRPLSPQWRCFFGQVRTAASPATNPSGGFSSRT